MDVRNEDVLYNWIDRAFMFISKGIRPFKVAKEMHLIIIQALIDLCSKIGSFIVDLSASTCMCFFSKNSIIISASKFLSDHLSLYMQTIKAYQTLGHHILVLKLDMEVYMKVLEPLVEVAMLELDVEYVHSFNIDFLDKKCLGVDQWVYEPHGSRVDF
jgi:hypothetical protein